MTGARMSNPVMRRALRRATAQIRYVRPVSPGAATSLVRAVYAQVKGVALFT